MEKQYIPEEKVSLAGLINNLRQWIGYLLSVGLKVIVGAVLIGGLFFAYHQFKSTNYTAETRFVLESESGGLGQLSSLASLAGVNIGGMSENNVLFQLDNIVELYTSYNMMKQTLLTREVSTHGDERLISWYARENKLEKKWEKLGINFEIPEQEMVVRHDSLLKEVVKDIREKNLVVSKPNRKLSILSVIYTSKDQLFAKTFNEVLVEHVNEFYLKAKTQKTGENLEVLSHQADSVKRVLDASLQALALFEEQNPNMNPLRSSSRLPREKIQIDIQASSVVYQEIVKNLEIAKIAHRNNTPLIQIIDSPVLPLADDHMKWYKALVIGLFLGGFLMVAYFTLIRIYTSLLEQEDSAKQ